MGISYKMNNTHHKLNIVHYITTNCHVANPKVNLLGKIRVLIMKWVCHIVVVACAMPYMAQNNYHASMRN